MTHYNPYDKAHELAKALVQCDVYGRYVNAKRNVEKYPEFKEKILRVRGRQMEINRAHILGEELPVEFITELTQELNELNKNAEIAEFFEAETQFIRMFTDIQEIIQKALDYELKE